PRPGPTQPRPARELRATGYAERERGIQSPPGRRVHHRIPRDPGGPGRDGAREDDGRGTEGPGRVPFVGRPVRAVSYFLLSSCPIRAKCARSDSSWIRSLLRSVI